MADIDIRRAHDLGIKGARAAAEKMADQLGRKFDLKGTWAGNVLRFERPGVSGSLTVSEKDLALSVALGFLLKAMKGSIESAVKQELDKVLASDRAASPRPSPKAEGEKPTSKKASPRPKKGG